LPRRCGLQQFLVLYGKQRQFERVSRGAVDLD
jgi:hypothetical protein